MHLGLYQAATRLASRVIQRGKLGAALAGRRGAAERWEAWALARRGPQPLVWVHAASAGETAAAEPVIRRLRARSSVDVVRTFSSPAAAGGDDGAAHADFIPLDTRAETGRVLDALRPAALIFSRGDVWPVLAQEAARRGVPLVVVGGVARALGRRRRWPARRLLASVHRLITAVGAASEQDAEGWRVLGVAPQAVRVTGDPRHDAVLERPLAWEPLRHLFAWRERVGPIIAGGSLEPSDHNLIAEAIAALRRAGAGCAWLLVPHEPTRDATDQLRTRLHALRLDNTLWSGGPIAETATVLVATQVGHLADWYASCAAAYVGGGFSSRGTHSVIEPAAWGCPVAFASEGALTADERALVTSGGGMAIAVHDGAAALARWCGDGLRDGGSSGLAARRVLQPGAATRNADLVVRAANLGG